jgi:hypothetical protein
MSIRQLQGFDRRGGEAVKKGKPIPNLLLAGLLAAAMLLAGFTLAPGSRGVIHFPNLQASPNSLQVKSLSAGEAADSNPGASRTSQLSPEATVGENAAMLAVETLLLNTSTYRLELPVVIR